MVYGLDRGVASCGAEIDDARAVVDEEVMADLGAGVDVDAGLAVGVAGHDPRDDLFVEIVEGIRDPIGRDRHDARIGGDDLAVGRRRWIAVERRLEIHRDVVADSGQALDQPGRAVRSHQRRNDALDDPKVAGELSGRGVVGNDDTFNGHLDDARITIGVARYIDTFTPPVFPVPIV